MLKFIKKIQTLIVIIFTLTLLIIMFFLPAFVQIASIVVLSISISMAFMFTFQKHWNSYQQAECTREKMTRSLIFDITGLLFTMGAAIYAGRLTGGDFGIRAGFWIGLLAGFLGGFLSPYFFTAV